MIRSPGAAVGWEFVRKHRWGLSAVALYLVALATIDLLARKRVLPFDVNEELKFALVVIVPLSATFYYLLAVFSYGFAGDLAGRRSVYPSRMFTLPVSSAALAGWPMLFGVLVMAAVWTVTRLFASWPSPVRIPVVWPGLLVAIVLAWTQALMWTSFGLRGVRVLLILIWLTLLAVVAQVVFYYQPSEFVMLGILMPLLPLAFVAAWSGITRARRGDVPEWRKVFDRLERVTKRRHRRIGFLSPAKAQAWLEWQRSGLSLPLLVAYLLPFELALLFAARGAPALIVTVIIIVLLTPPFMAVFVATTVRRSGHRDREGYGLTPFLATRPMTSASIVAAKLIMAVRSTVVTWLVVLIALPIALYVSDTEQVVLDLARRVKAAFGTPRAVTLALLVGFALVATTWRQLVQSLYVGLSGRAWLVKATVFLALVLVTVGAPLLVWLTERIDVLISLLDALPWIFAVLAGFKLSAAAWVTTQLHNDGLVSDRALVIGVACWLVVVLVLHVLFVWLVDTPFIPSYLLLLLAVLLTPLVRVSAAPLALAWNRHR